TNNLVAHITGGNSACYLIGSPASQPPGSMSVTHIGEHTLYNVSLRICDVDALDRAGKSNHPPKNLFRSAFSCQLGDLLPGHAYPISGGPFDEANSDARRFNVFFTARNGSFFQLLRFRKIDNVWMIATKVQLSNGQIPYQHIQEGFPRNQFGE